MHDFNRIRSRASRFVTGSFALLVGAGCAQGTTSRVSGGEVDLMNTRAESTQPLVDRVWLGVVPPPSAMGNAPATPPGQPTTEMQAVLDQFAAFGAPPLAESSPANARQAPSPTDAVMALLASRMQPAPAPMVTTSHVTIPGPHGKMLARVYTPQGSGPFPVVVYYHGGGWVIANLNTYEPSAKAIAEASGAVVVSVAYHQAPTHRFPAAANDAFAAYQWVLDSAAKVNGDPSRVAVAGESAGGNLAAVVSMMARDRNVSLPVHQLLIYPVASYDLDSPSYVENANAKPLGKAGMHWFFDKYLTSQEDTKNPYAIPLAAENLSGLPPATIINAQIDPLRWDGEELARRLRAANVPVEQRTFEGVTHEFFGMGAVLPEAREAVQMAGTRLKIAFARQ